MYIQANIFAGSLILQRKWRSALNEEALNFRWVCPPLKGTNADLIANKQALLKSVYTVFDRATLQTEELIARSKDAAPRQPVFDPEAIPARSRFLARRIKLVQNLMRWRKFTGEMLGAGEMASRLVDGCIRSVAEEGWDVGGEAAMQKVRRGSVQRNFLRPMMLV